MGRECHSMDTVVEVFTVVYDIVFVHVVLDLAKRNPNGFRLECGCSI